MTTERLKLVELVTRGIQQHAERYIARGWAVVPLAPGAKSAIDDGWKNLVFKPEDFRPTDNIGLKSIGGLVVVDIDCPEAVACADAFLPDTGAVWGRPSKPRSKRLYKSAFPKIIALKDQDPDNRSSTLIEIRVNHQDVAPPSTHPEGETLAWDGECGDPAEVEAARLLRAVRLLATTALIGRYYNPEGNRHGWVLALAGTLRGLGLTEVEAKLVVTQAALWASDSKVHDRMTEVHATYAHGDDEPITGAKTLKELSRRSENFVATLGKIWGSTAASAFVMDKKGERILADSQENIRRALDKLGIKLSHNEFSNTLLIGSQGTSTAPIDDAAVDKLWLDIDTTYKFRPSPVFFERVIKHCARQNPVHPVKNYLEALQWDGAQRLDHWLNTYGGAKDTPLNRAIAALVLIAAVRRVRQPGCKFDELLVLISPQGSDKSSALRGLCPDEAWFSDDVPLGVDSKQVIERTNGKWLIEAAELVGLSRREADSLKAWLSRQVDGPVRLAYARNPVEVPRQFITIGTTNTHLFLKDRTGNRRFWPVRVDRFDTASLRRDRDQLWAEASHREAAGESIRLVPSLYADAAREQEERQVEDAWTDTLRDFLGVGVDSGAPSFMGPDDPPKDRILLNDVWAELGISVERRDDRATERVNSIMQALGYEKKQARGSGSDGKSAKRWCRIGGQLSLGDADA